MVLSLSDKEATKLHTSLSVQTDVTSHGPWCRSVISVSDLWAEGSKWSLYLYHHSWLIYCRSWNGNRVVEKLVLLNEIMEMEIHAYWNHTKWELPEMSFAFVTQVRKALWELGFRVDFRGHPGHLTSKERVSFYSVIPCDHLQSPWEDKSLSIA